MRAMRHFSEGVTTIEVKSGYGLNRDDELKMLRAIKEGNDEIPADLVATCLAAHVLPYEFGDETQYLDFLLKMYGLCQKHNKRRYFHRTECLQPSCGRKVS